MDARVRKLDLCEIPLSGAHLIEASAGTGKTYTIASLYLRLLLERGWRVQEILVVTFTKAATAELRGRIRDRIRAALEMLEADPMRTEGTSGPDPLLLDLLQPYRGDGAARRRLQDALICMDEAAIFTIHGVCQRVLQEHAFESGVLFETEFVSNQSDLLAAVAEDFWRRTFYGTSSGLARLADEAWGSPQGLLYEIAPYLPREDIVLVPEVSEDEVSPEVYRRLFERVRESWSLHQAAIVAGVQSLTASRDLSRAVGNYQPADLNRAVSALTEFCARGIDDFLVPAGLDLFTRERFEKARTQQGIRKGVAPPVPEFFDLCGQLQDLCRKKRVQLRAAALHHCRDALLQLKNSRKLLSYDDLIRRLHDSLRTEKGESLAQAVARQFPVALIDEFQDTDPGQYGIFRTVYQERPGRGLFMIGDPKQAIYSFRGGDIFTYMQARRATVSHYTLDTNWRSTDRYLHAVNALFSQHRRPFVYADDIPYHPVLAAPDGKANRERLSVAGTEPPPFCIWFFGRAPANAEPKAIPKWRAREAIVEACAAEIQWLLDSRNEVRIGHTRVEPRQIAVLVRTHREGARVQEALSARGVPSVYSGRSSIFSSDEAEEIARLLAAVAQPQDDRLLRAALATEMFGKTAGWFSASDDAQWDEVFQQFASYHEDWERRGFIAMFRRILDEQRVAERLMQHVDGERRLTNLLHLGELLQAAGQEQPGMQGLLRWFAEARRRPDENSDEQQLRLESDADRVQIVTLHKSKGLEYDIVFLPFCWDSKPQEGKAPYSFHDEERPDLPLVLDLAASSSHLALADKERLAEELRLLYVGATRARYRCYLAWGQINGARDSALGYLLHQDEGMQDPVAEVPTRIGKAQDAALLADLRAMDAGSGSFEITALPEPGVPKATPTPVAGPALAVRIFSGSIDASWRIASYTSLSAVTQQPTGVAEPDHDTTVAVEPSEGEESPAPPNSIFAFPKGAQAGTFLHELFEILNFPAARGSLLAETVTRLLRKHGYDDGVWGPAVASLVEQVLDTVLDPELGLCLRSIGSNRRLNELKFHFPLARLRSALLNDTVGLHPLHHDDPPAFQFDDARGVMLGFIDLVFEHGGRYYVVDYKSNHLGNCLEHYASQRLGPVIRAHGYQLQYLIYTVALHRYLGRRLPGYAYSKHFGGVYYLFLRGMDSSRGSRFGVYADKPEPMLVDRLDALFSGYPR